MGEYAKYTNRLLKRFIGDRWWLAGGVSAANCAVAYQPKGATSLAASYSNLNNPGTNDATPGTAPTWDVTNGWKFNGNDQYLTTPIIPNNQNWTYIYKFTNHAVNNRSFLSVGTTGAYVRFICMDVSRTQYINGNTPFQYTNGTTSQGVLAIAGNKAYKNGVDEGLTLTDWVGTPTLPSISISCRHTIADVYDLHLAVYIQALAIYNTVLTPTQVGLLTTAMNTL